jgi:hypothetical protein
MATFGHAEVSMRSYASSHHLWIAEHFARLAKDIEDAHTGRAKFSVAHRGYVTSAIFSAVAFLEAAINEIFDDVEDNHSGYVDNLAADCRRLMAGLWSEKRGSVERWPALDKYRVALLCSGSPAFDKGHAPYQDVPLLIELRNELTHARPQTRMTGEMDKLAKGLSSKFEPSRLMQNVANPYFPDSCLSAGCAKWAANTARAFTDEFFKRLEIEPNYQRVHGFEEP